MKQKKLTYLSGKRVVGIFVEKPFPMPPRLLKQVERGAIDTEEATTSFLACPPFNPLLCPFSFLLIFLIKQIEMDCIIMVLQNCNHNSFEAVVDGSDGDSCPFSQILHCGSISIVAYAIEKNHELNRDRELWVVKIVVENHM
jgi:hypothetical protein